MDIANIVIIITILLIASVVGSVYFTKKEKEAALKRQQIASYRFRADEAQDLYDGLQHAGLEKIAYQFILERIIVNLKAAYNIDPKAPGIKLRLISAESILETLDQTDFYIEMPSAMTELHGLVGRLNKLVKYLILVFQKKMVTEALYQQLMPAIQRTLLKFDAEGHIKMGHQAANEGQAGTAKQCYLHAKNKLESFGSDDSYVAGQLEKVDELLASLKEAETLHVGSESPKKPVFEAVTPLADERNKEEINAATSQEEINKRSDAGDDDDDLFAPKKKW